MTIEQIKKRHEKTRTEHNPVNWFKADNWFKTQIESEPVRLRLMGQDRDEQVYLFLTSEKAGRQYPRRYSVRKFFYESGRVDTCGPFCLMTNEQAEEVLETLTFQPIDLEHLIYWENDVSAMMNPTFLSIRRKLQSYFGDAHKAYRMKQAANA